MSEARLKLSVPHHPEKKAGEFACPGGFEPPTDGLELETLGGTWVAAASSDEKPFAGTEPCGFHLRPPRTHHESLAVLFFFCGPR
jgi:hypothetical protein